MKRWSVWAIAASAALAIGGCSKSNENKSSPSRTETPQQQSGEAKSQATGALQAAEKQSDEAAKAHEKAADEQKQLADAQKEAREKQDEAQKARQELQEKSQTAQQSTQQAQQETTEATAARAQSQQESEQQRQQQAKQEQQQTDQQQASAQTSQSPQGGMQPSAGQRSVDGSVVRASQDELVLRQQGGLPDLRLKVDGNTPVMMDGRQASITELREGTQVRASYDEQNGEPRAVRIEAQGSGSTGGQSTAR